ncbi:MAG: pyridoxal phosphate-dependent aminotransferase [Sphingomonadales bacterium]|nr:pyridoxal phosphate-dependent aminotransferase [Sphingomonadales bacterium]MDE2170125.1 pyridoxal phosphate-dependent aminotransferase [Sphingomonadales bacterium]
MRRLTSLRYLEWVHHVWAKGGLSLYDSSVSPPDALLAQAARRVFDRGAPLAIPATFGGGSAAMLACLADVYGVSDTRLLATSGVASGLALVFRAMARPGDHVLVEQPGYQPFEDMALAAGLRVEGFARRGAAMRPDLDDLRARLRGDTRMIVLSHLHNPTGQALRADDLAALASQCEQAGIWLVIDEIYGAFVDDRALAARDSGRVISLSGLSKIFGLGALRCGWIMAAPSVVESLRRASLYGDAGLSAASQAIALQVLRDWPRFRARTQVILDTNRPIIAAWLERVVDLGLVSGELAPQGCLTFPRLVEMARTEGFCAWLQANQGVIVAPGCHWAAPGHVRLGFGMERARLEQGLDGLQQGLLAYRAMSAVQRQVVDSFIP